MKSERRKLQNIIMVISYVLMLAFIPVVYSCQVNQVERYYNRLSICCYPVECKSGQRFSLCKENNGHDTCQNCPEGFGHSDQIHTILWTYELDPCVELEDCEKDFSDLRTEGGECVCDRTRGYFGLDRHKCSVDTDHRCKKSGHQLTQIGDCERCGPDHFKDKEDYTLCLEKTRCAPDQEINFPGSHIEDRTCRKRMNIMLFPSKHHMISSTTQKNISKNDELEKLPSNHNNSTSSVKVVDNGQQSVEKPILDDDASNESNQHFSPAQVALVVVAVVVCLAVLVLAVVLLRLRYKTEYGQPITGDNNSPFSTFLCCSKHSVVHVKDNTGDIHFGDKKTIIVNSSFKEDEATVPMF